MLNNKKPLLCITFFFALATGVPAYFFCQQAMEIKARRERDSDAYAIRDALVIYGMKHDGKLPPSLLDLTYDRNGVDPASFQLLAPGSRVGQRNLDVWVRAKQGGNGKYNIYIYADRCVAWE